MAIAINLPEGIDRFVFKNGARILIYTNERKNIIGVKRNYKEKKIRMDDPEFIKVIEFHRETIESKGKSGVWFPNPKGHKLSHGGSKKPAEANDKTTVTVEEFRDVALKILSKE